MIHVEPTRPLRRDFAVWATAQDPKIATVSPSAFAVPADLYADVPEELLIGAQVDGHRYVSPLEDARAAGPRMLACGLCYEENGEEVHPHPECPGPPVTLIAEDGTETFIPLTPPGGPSAPLTTEPDPPHPPPPPGPVSGAESGKPGYGCEDCPRVFPKARGLRMHQRQAHPNPTSSEVPTSDDPEVS